MVRPLAFEDGAGVNGPSRFIRKLALVIAVSGLPALAAGATGSDTRDEMRSLDEQVQEIKSDVLSISSELATLEERLLFPSNTQVTIFVDLVEDQAFRLDAVQLDIDDSPAAHHIYSFKELEALQQGGVQRLFMGNLPTGAHSLRVSVVGKLTNGREFRTTEEFSFDKDVEPSLLGVTLAARSGDAAIELKDW
jgi:hypothetical protein